MKTIYKYQFQTTDYFYLDLPLEAKILSVQTQNDIPCIWALVDPNVEKERRRFRIFGTGHDIQDSIKMTYIGTYQQIDGRLVFHLFEVED